MMVISFKKSRFVTRRWDLLSLLEAQSVSQGVALKWWKSEDEYWHPVYWVSWLPKTYCLWLFQFTSYCALFSFLCSFSKKTAVFFSIHVSSVRREQSHLAAHALLIPHLVVSTDSIEDERRHCDFTQWVSQSWFSVLVSQKSLLTGQIYKYIYKQMTHKKFSVCFLNRGTVSSVHLVWSN